MDHQLRETADAVELLPGAPATATIIWLHGLGADGHDFAPIVPELRLPAATAIRFLFPHAPVRGVTLNMGMRMRAWFDIKSLDSDNRADETGLRESVARIQGLIDRERQSGIAANRVVIAGFSQGGAVAMHAALRYLETLAGVLLLSTYLPLSEALAAELAVANRDTPVWMGHGSFDPLLPMALGAAARDFLRTRGYAVEWKEYPMQHQVCQQEIIDIGRWLASVLP